jgi:PQQ-like domain/IPT/TIG domain
MKSFQNFTAAVIAAASFIAVSAHATPGQITALSATTLDRSGYLEISGTNFGTDGSVLIDGFAAPVADWQSRKIIAYVPEAAQLASVPVQVVNTLGEPSNSLNLTVTARQPDGRTNWRFRQDGPYSKVRPVIGPDGTIYSIDAFFHLYALTPDGGLKWVVRGAGDKALAVGADNTVYTASESDIKAFNSDGTSKWTYVENPMALFLVGMSVGPDGNIYVVATEGVGAFSLTPDGVLRWKQPEPYDAQQPVQYQELVFGLNGTTTQLYYYANSHLKALRLDGTTAWTLNSDFGQPAVSPLDGSIHAPYGAYSSNGPLMWIFSSPYPYNTSSPPDISSDGTHYFVQNTIELFGLTPTGTQKWHVTMRDSGDNAIVDPQNTQLVLGSATTLNNAGYIKSASTADGHELWRVTLPKEAYFNQFPDSRARFSPDGTTAYVITATATGDNNTSRSFVYALDAKLGTATDVVTVTAAQYDSARSLLQIKATDSDPNATLQAYVTSTNALIGNLNKNATGYVGKFSWPSNPVNITVKSNLGGSASVNVRVK